MVDDKDDEYEAQCAAFLTVLESVVPTEANITEVYKVDIEHIGPKVSDILRKSQSLKHHWTDLAVNTAEANELHLPEEGIYKPPRLWE